MVKILMNKKMQLFIYTRKPNNHFSKEFLKEVGRFLFKKARGPQAVNDSLMRGLKELNEPFFVNRKSPKLDGSEIFFVNTSLDALKWLIELKKKGKIKMLIAGPNLVAFPNDHDKIILNKNIDYILFPSQWTKDFFCSKYKELEEKIKIWPAGVMTCELINEEKKEVLIFCKNNKTLCAEIKSILEIRGDYFDILEYGKFKQNDYYKLLNKRKYLIYISESESQGIALQEAWMRNVPTFIWNRGYCQIGTEKWFNEKISAPYLNEKCGLFFKDIDDFKNKLHNFLNSDFSTRDYCLNNLSDKKSAEIFLEIIKKYDK